MESISPHFASPSTTSVLDSGSPKLLQDPPSQDTDFTLINTVLHCTPVDKSDLHISNPAHEWKRINWFSLYGSRISLDGEVGTMLVSFRTRPRCIRPFDGCLLHLLTKSKTIKREQQSIQDLWSRWSFLSLLCSPLSRPQCRSRPE